ncbi:hypothetical protein [Methanoculleus taiwanensis]|uniref:hypothetical protein n=1 Tax=Methanoculleus taiwanensis TaxID=1550565 RepID=UPI000FFF5EDD|nr:hypothetical protein [Methanoculleus taiwanensis]
MRETLGVYVTYVVQLLILLNAGISIAAGNLLYAVSSLGAFGLTLVPYILTRSRRMQFPWGLNLLIAISLYMHVAGHVGGYYVQYAPYYDKAAHLISSVTITTIGLVVALLADRLFRMKMTRGFIVLFAFLLTMATGAIWEIYEFALDQIFGTSLQHGNIDTMVDLIVDMAGALLITALGYLYLRSSSKDEVVNRLLTPYVDEADTPMHLDESEIVLSVREQ